MDYAHLLHYRPDRSEDEKKWQVKQWFQYMRQKAATSREFRAEVPCLKMLSNRWIVFHVVLVLNPVLIRFGPKVAFSTVALG